MQLEYSPIKHILKAVLLEKVPLFEDYPKSKILVRRARLEANEAGVERAVLVVFEGVLRRPSLFH